MNYNNVVDYQLALARLSHPGRDVCTLSRTISLRSHKSCHAIKTRRIPDQWEWSLNIESGSTLFVLFLL